MIKMQKWCVLESVKYDMWENGIILTWQVYIEYLLSILSWDKLR